MTAPANIVQAARDLVDRARAGDQNAMAILARVGDEARRGNSRARLAYGLAQIHIDRQPIMGDEARPIPPDALAALRDKDTLLPALLYVLDCKDGEAAACSALLHGPILFTPACINEIGLSCLSRDGQSEGFFAGCKAPFDREAAFSAEVPPSGRMPYRLGRIIARARALQALRAGQAPIYAVHPGAAWEHGE